MFGPPCAALSSGDRHRREGAAAGARCDVAPPCMDALAHILLSLLALLGGGPGAARDSATPRRPIPQGVPFAISDDAAQRAFPSELLVARAVGISAARAVRRLVRDRAAATRASARSRAIPPTTGRRSTPTWRATAAPA